jgi:DivIVA domain-containing protein
MKITPQDISTQEFKRSLRGYDMDEVDAFLTPTSSRRASRRTCSSRTK